MKTSGTHERLRMESDYPGSPAETAVLTVYKPRDVQVDTLLDRGSRYTTENHPPIVGVVVVGVYSEIIKQVPEHVECVAVDPCTEHLKVGDDRDPATLVALVPDLDRLNSITMEK